MRKGRRLLWKDHDSTFCFDILLCASVSFCSEQATRYMGHYLRPKWRKQNQHFDFTLSMLVSLDSK